MDKENVKTKRIKHNLENQIFGYWTVDKKAPSRGCNVYWFATCRCGLRKEVSQTSLLKGTSKSCIKCKPMRWADKNFTEDYPEGPNNTRYRGYKELSGRYWSNLKNRIKNHKLIFNITKEYIYDLYISQNKKCAISNVDIRIVPSWREVKSGEHTASLDRIDSSKGYVKGNVQWVHATVNQMKWDFDQEYFLKLCKSISDHHS